MANERFEELLRQLPLIANAVNAFQSESIQEMAYKELVAALKPNKPEGSATKNESDSTSSSTPAKPASTKTAVSTQDVLALARAGAGKSTPAGNGHREKKESAPATETAPPTSTADQPLGDPSKPSEVELQKEASNFLQG